MSDIFNHGKIDRCLTASRRSAHRPCRGHDAITVATPAVRRALRWPRSTIASGTGDAVMIDSTQCTMHTWCTHVSTHVYHVCTMSHGTHMVHTWCAQCGAHHVCTMCIHMVCLRVSYHDIWVPALNSFYMKFSADR